MFESNRVKFYMQTEVSELRAQEGKVGPSPPPRRFLSPSLCPGAAHSHSPQLKEVVLKSSKVLRADVCVVGIGEWGAGGGSEHSHPCTLDGELGPVPSPPPACLHFYKMGTPTVPPWQGCWGVMVPA